MSIRKMLIITFVSAFFVLCFVNISKSSIHESSGDELKMSISIITSENSNMYELVSIAFHTV